MFKAINKSILLKLVLLHIIVTTVSNVLVVYPLEILGFKLTWAAFTFPLVVVATDLTVRLLGKKIARTTIAVVYPIAIATSIIILIVEGSPLSIGFRVGFASATAYAVGTLLDVYAFQLLREKFSIWWLAPAVSTVVANIIDTYTFFFTAFSDSEDVYMATNWLEIATSQVVLKIIVGILFFLPVYGLLLRFLSRRLKPLR